VLADVDRFKKFGAKMTIKSLSERFHKTMGEVMAMQAEEIYEFLLMDFEESMYKKDLEKAHRALNKK
jgi:predicted O-methyltransferase YrrM